MSLLLDALKKAAEKKAQKDAENTALDNTEVVTRTQVTDDHTVADKTVAMTETELDATSIDATQLDATKLDATELDATRLDATQLDKTSTDTTLKIDSTQIDVTQLDHPDQDSTQEIDVRKLDLSSLASTQPETNDSKDDLSASDDETYLDATRLDATKIDATELSSTQVDATQIDSKPPHAASKTDSTNIETSQKNRSTQESAQESTQELDIRNLDLSQLAAEENEIIFESGDDLTLSFIDEDDEIEDETLVLTPDDITEFLGDGNYPKKTKRQTVTPPPVVRHEPSDDTTITNSESLSLTNIEQDDMELESKEDEGYPLAQDSTRTESTNYRAYDGRVPQQDRARDDDEDDRSTMMNATESTTSSVDIEKLTNDETVTIKDSTFTRTFAPDNYDRTLMKLTDNDVSRIFPGMRSETDSVMTPDYAKKVFISKSRGVKNYYYKIYLGIALCILLVVVVWGLFEIQSESDSIDNNLVALKRDPMPGIIKPKGQPEPVNLFSSTPQVDNQAIKLIEKANTVDSAVSGEMQSDDSVTLSEGESEVDNAAQNVPPADSVSSVKSQTQNPVAVKAETGLVKKQPASAQTRPTSLQISSNNRVSKKDQLLAEAYAAYQAGDIDKARKQYQQVITLDPGNRDALLGRAAIHVYDNQFETAITLYQKLLLANPKDDLAMTSLISVANVDPKTGETEIKRLLNELPDSPYLHFALGNMYGNQNRWSEAQNEYFKALQSKPNDPNYAYNMAISLEHLEKSTSAITFYKRALENKSNGLTTFSESVVLQRIEVLSQ